MSIENKEWLLEEELENYLIQNKFDIYEYQEKTIDSTKLIDIAVDLGFIPYRLDREEGELQGTYLFARR